MELPELLQHDVRLTESIFISITPGTRQKLEETAKAHSTSIAAVVRLAIDKLFNGNGG